MSILIVALPVPPRLSSHGVPGAVLAAAEYDYVFTADGGPRLQAGRGAPAQLPKAQTVIAVVPVQGAAWHRLALPRAPAGKLRAALASMLEEVLLEDDADVHVAVAPHAKVGETVWVAALNRPWLKAQLEALESVGPTVDRVVPAWPPDDAPAGHFFPDPRAEADAGPQLAWRDAQGPLCMPAASEGVRTFIARLGSDVPVRWTAEPECAADAVRLAGGNVAALSASEFLYNATRTEWNLRQFDLAPQRRGSRAAKELSQQLWSSPQWRPARYGVALLLVLNLVGANVWAWQQRQSLTRQKAAMTELLQKTFPQVRSIFDAPAQMQKEIDLLRASAGKPGENDLESLMYAAEAAWPPSRAPADGLKFEPGRLMITSAGWSPQEVEAFRTRLRPLGYDAESVPGRLTLTRAKLPVGGLDQPDSLVRPAAGTGTAPPAPPPGAQPGTPQGARPPVAPPVQPGMARPVPPVQQQGAVNPNPPAGAQGELPHRMPNQPTGVKRPDEQ
jgi:general secretion pathway protein L